MPTDVRVKNGVHILKLSGEFALGRQVVKPLNMVGQPMDDLAEQFKDVLNQGGKNLLLDVGAVTFIDSAGLGELVASKKRTMERDGDIKILHPSGGFWRIMEMTALDRVFESYDDEDEALRSFKP